MTVILSKSESEKHSNLNRYAIKNRYNLDAFKISKKDLIFMDIT
jgi:hypothetical protein